VIINGYKLQLLRLVSDRLPKQVGTCILRTQAVDETVDELRTGGG
jgi:hypothetical protein